MEQKAATPEQLAIREINSGIYCFRADLLWKHIDEIRPDNPAGEYYLTDMVAIFRRAGHAVEPCSRGRQELLGINTRVELAEVDRMFRERKMHAADAGRRDHREAGDGDHRCAGADRAGHGRRAVRADPGPDVIGEDCRIGACSIIHDSELGDRVVVGPFTIIGTSGWSETPRRSVRPAAHGQSRGGGRAGRQLRRAEEDAPGRRLQGHAPGLPGRLRDRREANIGAGTITCNYDGKRKHPTKIGDGAFVGSNSTLVAPVEIGAGSYVGAGSVITEDVPEDALALGRGRQVNKPGWAKKRRGASKPETAGLVSGRSTLIDAQALAQLIFDTFAAAPLIACCSRPAPPQPDATIEEASTYPDHVAGGGPQSGPTVDQGLPRCPRGERLALDHGKFSVDLRPRPMPPPGSQARAPIRGSRAGDPASSRSSCRPRWKAWNCPRRPTTSRGSSSIRRMCRPPLQRDVVVVDFALDKYLPPGEVEKRELGIIVSTAGLEAK